MVRRWEIGIGLLGLLFAAFVVLIWAPNDIKGAFLETTRAGKPEPGDAFFPVLLGIFIGLASLMQMLSAFTSKRTEEEKLTYSRLDFENLKFLFIFIAILGVCLTVLYWAGPMFVWLLDTDATYRQLVDTAPYKYVGLSVGGFMMTFTFITWAEGQIRWRSAIVSITLIILLILIFDVLLSNIQLPPNADF